MASISITATSPISWTDITPTGGSGQPFFGLAINADASLIAASDGTSFWTTATQGALIPWAKWPAAPGSASIAVSDNGVLGSGPGPSFAGLSPTYQSITAASAHYAGVSYTAALTQAAQTYGLDPDYYARQIYNESGFNPNAGSSKGAVGIAQFTAPTAKQVGLTNRLDPYASLLAGAQLMNNLKHMFYNNLGLALAGYNGGPGVPEKFLSDGFMNDESRNYVLAITGRTIEEWTVGGYRIIAANKQTANIAVSSNTASSWKDQLPLPGAMPGASVAMDSGGANAAAGGTAALWVTRTLGAIS